MSSSFGNRIRVQLFGESHGKAVGAVIDGLPAGEAVDEAEILRFLERRRPGRSSLMSSRNETDRPIFLSGLYEGHTTGTPLAVIMENADARPENYAGLSSIPRPGHADYTASVRYHGAADMRGGGHFSARLTAPLCAAGSIALQILERRGIFIGAHIAEIDSISDDPFPAVPDADLFRSLADRELPVLNDEAGRLMKESVLRAGSEGDSVGGIVECAAVGLPAGLGSPRFEGADSRIASVLFGIPAVKGVEFGAGFGAARLRGSQNNDPFVIHDGRIITSKNDAGGILGGITNGMPIIVRAAFKPTPSISIPQKTVDLDSMEPSEITLQGRHDPCVVIRAVPVVEAAVALVLLDMTEES